VRYYRYYRLAFWVFLRRMKVVSDRSHRDLEKRGLRFPNLRFDAARYRVTGSRLCAVCLYDSFKVSNDFQRADRARPIDPVIVVTLHNARDFAAAGDRGGGRQRVRKRGSNPDATVESWVGSRSFQLQSLVEREFDARRAQPQPSRHGRQERYRQGHHQQRAGSRKVRNS